MREFRNEICWKFSSQINEEIAWGAQNDTIYKLALQDYHITPEAKEARGIHKDEPLTLYDISKDSVISLNKFRFIYLISILEAFGKELIAQKLSISTDRVSETCQRNYQSAWQSQESPPPNRSTSFTNPKWIAFVLRQIDQRDFSSIKNEYFWESGSLRKCIVHHQGIISNDNLRQELRSTISALNAVDAIGTIVSITDVTIWHYIDDMRQFITLCDDI